MSSPSTVTFRVVLVVAGARPFELGDQHLHSSVFDLGLVHEVVLVEGLANGGIEDLFLELRVHGQRGADLTNQLDLLLRRAVLLQ